MTAPALLVIAAAVLFAFAGLRIKGRYFDPPWYAAACLVLAFFWDLLDRAF